MMDSVGIIYGTVMIEMVLEFYEVSVENLMCNCATALSFFVHYLLSFGVAR